MIRLAASGIALIFSMVFIMHGIAMVDCPDASHVPGQSFRVDIHAAGRQELDLLPGIGPIMAERIMAWRAAGHRAENAEQLQAIDGIGPRTIEKLRPWIVP
ncbi:MAG: helix-hairpin-helix domain-containing protein [Phycisphaerales bacterium]|nr:helix-hairpin-helix domain-containing protein [Phycisphaerales bacterium]